jgi:hypothetical protein
MKWMQQQVVGVPWAWVAWPLVIQVDIGGHPLLKKIYELILLEHFQTLLG